MAGFFQALTLISIGLVFAVLCVGVSVMLRGGALNRIWGNRLMRLRVVMQLAAILIMIGAMYFSGI